MTSAAAVGRRRRFWLRARAGRRACSPARSGGAAPARRTSSCRRSDTALNAAHGKYKGLKEGKNADYIPALAKVDSEHLRHRAGDRRTARSTPPATSKSEVSIQSISKVFTMARVIEDQGAEVVREQHRRRRHRPGVQLDRRGRAVQGQGDEPHGQPGRHHHDQHGQGRRRRRGLEARSSARSATSPAGRCREPGGLSSPRRRPTSATRPSRC